MINLRIGTLLAVGVTLGLVMSGGAVAEILAQHLGQANPEDAGFSARLTNATNSGGNDGTDHWRMDTITATGSGRNQYHRELSLTKEELQALPWIMTAKMKIVEQSNNMSWVLNDGTVQWQWWASDNPSGTFEFAQTDTGILASSLADGEYHTFVAEHDGAGNTNAFIDGGLVATVNTSTANAPSCCVDPPNVHFGDLSGRAGQNRLRPSPPARAGPSARTAVAGREAGGRCFPLHPTFAG